MIKNLDQLSPMSLDQFVTYVPGRADWDQGPSTKD